MQRKRRQNTISKIFRNPKFIAFLGIFIFILILFPLVQNKKQIEKVDNEINGIEEEIAELNNQNKDLKNLINYLESNQFVEEQARINLGLKKQGEEVVVIGEDKQVINQESTENEYVELNDLSNLHKWWIYFFNKG